MIGLAARPWALLFTCVRHRSTGGIVGVALHKYLPCSRTGRPSGMNWLVGFTQREMTFGIPYSYIHYCFKDIDVNLYVQGYEHAFYLEVTNLLPLQNVFKIRNNLWRGSYTQQQFVLPLDHSMNDLDLWVFVFEK